VTSVSVYFEKKVRSGVFQPGEILREEYLKPLELSASALAKALHVVERKFFPRLEADDGVLAYFELNATVLSAKAAMRLNQLLSRMSGFTAPAARGSEI
jgi:hypothetical protein